MKRLSYKTRSVKNEDAERAWHLIDATGLPVGRLCSQIAHVIRGKHKPSFTPHTDQGDYVIVINAEKVSMSGSKWDQKEYISYSLYPGGQKRVRAKEMLEKHPTRIIEKAVKGMLPKTKLGESMRKKLFVYEGEAHPHDAQQPQATSFKL